MGDGIDIRTSCIVATVGVVATVTLLLLLLLLFSLLYRACCQVTQLLHQPLHIYKIYNFLKQ